MRICFVCNEYPPAPHGGIGTFVRALATYFSAAGYTVFTTGFAPNKQCSEPWTDKGVSVVPLRAPACLLSSRLSNRYSRFAASLLERLPLSYQLERLVRQHRIEIVESYDWSGPLWY